MDIKSKGIVLQTIKYSETSVISRIYTQQLGQLSFIINNVRTSKSVLKATSLQPGTLLELDFSYQESKSLHRIKEFRRSYSFRSLPFDIRKSAIAIFIIEIVTRCLHEHEVNEEQFDFVYEQFVNLDESEELNPFFHLQFLLFFTRYLGFFPMQNYSVNNPVFNLECGHFTHENDPSPHCLTKQESQLLGILLHYPTFEKPDLQYDRILKNAFLDKILRYYSLHIQTFKNVRSHLIFESVFG